MPSASPVPSAGVRRRSAVGTLTLALTLALAAWLAAGASPAGAQATAPAPATATRPAPTATPAVLDGIVANASGAAVDVAALNTAFQARFAAPRGLHGLVLLRRSCGGDAEAVLDAAIVQYGAAQRAGEMFNDTLAWLVCADPPYAAFTFAVDNPLAGYLDPPLVAAAMTAALAGGDVGAAAAAGLVAAADQLDRAPAALDARPTAAPAAPAPLSPPADDAPMAAALLWLVVGSLALVAVGRARRRRRPERPPATATEPDAVRELDAQIDLVARRLVADSPSLDRLLHALEPLGDGVRLDLLRRHQVMVRRAEALAREAEVVGHLRAAGELPERGDDALLRLEALLVEARALAVYTRQLEREAGRAARLHAEADALPAAAAAAIANARDAYAAVREAPAGADRRLPAPEAAFAVPSAWLASADDRAAAGARLDAGCRADDAIDLAERIARIARRLRRAEAAVEDARRRFGGLASHAPGAWADVAGNGAEAEASLDAAAGALEAALATSIDALGTDPPAGLAAGLAVAAQELARARQLVAAIDARRRHLEAAAAACAAHHAEVAAGLATAQTAAAAGTARDAVAAAADALARSDAATAGPAPDWAAALDGLAGAALHLVAAGHQTGGSGDAADRAETAAALAQLAAHGAVDRAERYLAAHRRDASATAARRVAAAAARLRAAERERERRAGADVRAAAHLGAARAAATAYAVLEADVRKAERRRIGWLPRAAGVVTPAAMATARRSHPFAGRIGAWEPPRPSGPPRPGAWGALPPGAPARPDGW